MLTLGHGKGLAPNGYRLLSPKTVDLLLHKNHLPGGKFINQGYTFVSELKSEGTLGFSLAGSVYMDGYDNALGNIAAVEGVHNWCGLAQTDVSIDPKNDLQILFLTQLLGAMA